MSAPHNNYSYNLFPNYLLINQQIISLDAELVALSFNK
jgi:hypothetical protein